MVLERLGQSLRDVLKKIANAPYIDQGIVKDVVRDVQRALLQADVNVKLVAGMTRNLERRALTEKPPAGMSSREHVIRILYDEIVKILGQGHEILPKKQKILLVGLYGQGKTTTAGKLAKHLQKRGLRVALIACDVHRPAAYDQLVQIGKKLNVPVYGDPSETRAIKILREGLKQFKDEDVIIIDTSGRHSLEDSLIDEIRELSKEAGADEKFLVMDATIGQQAGPQAKAFNDAVGITGVILTKMDGSAKGGGALSAVAETGAPICYIGVGEHLEDLEKFDPTRFVSRLLGMGDLQSLLEKAQEVMDEEKAKEMTRKLSSGKFTLKDMYEQMKMLEGVGPMSKVMQMIPGLSGKLSDKDIEQSQDRLRKFKVIMDSMTEEELEDPKIIKSSRVLRIARGSGTSPKDVRELLRQYNMSKKAIKGFLGNRKMRRQLLKQMSMDERSLG
jgi:signal recognition particle subunit SRP54